MAQKTVKYNKTEIKSLPNDQPVVYTITTETGRENYIGTAQRGEVQDRICDHIGVIPGAKVTIEPCHSIAEARVKEAKAIKQEQPKYNKQGK